MNDEILKTPDLDRLTAIAENIARVDIITAAYATPLSEHPYVIEIIEQTNKRIDSDSLSKKHAVRLRNNLSHLRAAVLNLDEIIRETRGDAIGLKILFSNALIRSFLIGCGIDGTKIEDFDRLLNAKKAGGHESGISRRRKATEWQEHAADLMKEIRTTNPSWAREKVAIDALGGWRLQGINPPTTSRPLVNLLKELEGSGEVPVRKK